MRIRLPVLPGVTLRRAGSLAFLFFLAKGILWVTAPLVFLWFGDLPA